MSLLHYDIVKLTYYIVKSVSDQPRDLYRPVKAARKVEPSNLARKTGQPASKAARKTNTEAIYVSSTSEESEPPDGDEDHFDLISAFARLTVPTRLRVHKCLPFLMRNLRLGFRVHCAAVGIPIYPKTTPPNPTRILYRYYLEDGGTSESPEPDDDWEEVVGESREWECPICDLHSSMNTRDMVVYHLQRDHAEVDASWEDLVGTPSEYLELLGHRGSIGRQVASDCLAKILSRGDAVV